MSDEQLPHDYLSTSCLHGNHDYCKAPVGRLGPKEGSKCKWCPAKCSCSCHEEVSG